MNGPRKWLVPCLLAIGAAVAVWLIVTGDQPPPSDDPAAEVTVAREEGAESTGSTPTSTLELADTSQGAVEELSGLVFPPGTKDFLTAQLDGGSQLDLTATVPPAEEAAFLQASGLAAPVAGERVVTHSSPLWELNPSGTIRGVLDSTGDVRRAVELVEEGGSVRIRAVITPSG